MGRVFCVAARSSATQTAVGPRSVTAGFRRSPTTTSVFVWRGLENLNLSSSFSPRGVAERAILIFDTSYQMVKHPIGVKIGILRLRTTANLLAVFRLDSSRHCHQVGSGTGKACILKRDASIPEYRLVLGTISPLFTPTAGCGRSSRKALIVLASCG